MTCLSDNRESNNNAQLNVIKYTISFQRDDRRRVNFIHFTGTNDEKSNFICVLILLIGALESIKESQRRSREAARRVQSAGGIIGESSVKREQAEDLLKRNSEFERTLTQNENDLRDLDRRVDRINAGIVDLNEKVSTIYILSDKPNSTD